MVILHGLFGMSDNWMSIARGLSEHYQVYLPDLRNHGRSPQHPVWNYEVMALDVAQLIIEEKIKNPLLIGHSMGGKTGMKLALLFPELISQLLVSDISPVTYQPGDDHKTIIQALRQISLSGFTEREKVRNCFLSFGLDEQVIQFLMKNLVRSGETLSWKFNFQDISSQIDEIGREIKSDTPFLKPVLFLRGEHSGYVLDTHLPKIVELFPHAELKTVAGAGHWIHAEKPEVMIREIREFYPA